MSLQEARNQGQEGEKCSSVVDGRTDVESCKKQTYICGGCNASFERLRSLKKHRCCYADDTIAHGNDDIANSKSGGQDYDKDDLAIDSNVQLPSADEPKSPRTKESKAFQCSVCQKKYKKHHSLTRHVALTHNGIMPWKCPKCSEEFFSSVKFKEHCKEHGILKPFKCDKCGSFFTSYEVLRVHDRIHTDERPFLCKTCGSTFKQRSNLQDHIRMHKNDRSFICGTCGKSFNLKGDLTKHLLLHTGERRFRCQYCPKAFPGISNFNRHMRTHTGVKPYTCSFCQKSFPRKEKLKEHERIHTGEKPFTCPTCGKSFSDSGNFSNHKKGHEDASLQKWKRFPKRITGSLSHEASSKSQKGVDATGNEDHLRPEGLCSIAPSQAVKFIFALPSQLIYFSNSQQPEPVLYMVDKGSSVNPTVNPVELPEVTNPSCQQQRQLSMNLNAQSNSQSCSQPTSEGIAGIPMCGAVTPPSDVNTISIAKDVAHVPHTNDNSLIPFDLVRSVESHPFCDSFSMPENCPNVILTPTKFLPVLKTLFEDGSQKVECTDKEKGEILQRSLEDTNSNATNEVDECKRLDHLSSAASGIIGDIPEKYCTSNLTLIDLNRADDTQGYNYQSSYILSPTGDSEQRKLGGILFATPTKSYPEEKSHSPSAMICSQILVTPEHASLPVEEIDQAKVKRRVLEL